MIMNTFHGNLPSAFSEQRTTYVKCGQWWRSRSHLHDVHAMPCVVPNEVANRVTRRKLQNALHRQGAQQTKERNFLCHAIVMSTEDEANVEVEGGQGPRCRSSRKHWPHGSPKASHIRPSHLCLGHHGLRHQHAQHLGLKVAKIFSVACQH